MAKKRTYGWSHERAKAKLPDPAGAPCPFCGRPMLPGQKLDADHPMPRALGGGGELRWAHRSCNRRAGAQLGLRLRGLPAPKWSDRWS